MEKLKPILEHKFWIFFSLAIILPLSGWWPAANQRVLDIEKRTKEVDASFTLAKKDLSASANDIWLDEILKINKVESDRENRAHYYLWDHQRKLQTWPDDYISTRMEGIHRLTPDNKNKIDSTVGIHYQKLYHKEVMKLYKTLNPYEVIISGSNPQAHKVKEEGVIAVKGKERVFPIFNSDAWTKGRISIETVWEAQEDLWLLQSIVNAINEMNRNSNTISESTIKMLVDIDFMGGNGRGYKKAKKKREKKNKKKDAEEDEPKSPAGNLGSFRLNKAQHSAAYNPADVFGAEKGNIATGSNSQSRGRGLGRRKEKRRFSDKNNNNNNKRQINNYIHTKQYRTKAQTEFRYVDNDKSDPYFTRGFHIHLVMDHRKIPQFVEELSKSPWAIKIVQCSLQNSRNTNHFGDLIPKSDFTFDKTIKKKKKQASGGFFGGGGDSDSGNNNSVTEEIRTGYTISLEDYYLAEVFISGKFTIYRKPLKIPADILEKENQVAEVKQENSAIKKGNSNAENIKTEENKSQSDKNNKLQNKPNEPPKNKESKNSVTLNNSK